MKQYDNQGEILNDFERKEKKQNIKTNENYQFLTDMDKQLIDELIQRFPETKMSIKMLISVKESPLVKKLFQDFCYCIAVNNPLLTNFHGSDYYYDQLKELGVVKNG